MNDLNKPLTGAPEVRKLENKEPAPDALSLHEQKLNDLVSGANLQAIDQWQRFRAETDEVMRTLREREQQILDLIAKLIADARSSGAAVAIFSAKTCSGYRTSFASSCRRRAT